MDKAGKWLVLVPRILLGLLFFASGIMGLFNFAEQPEGTPEGIAFIGAMMDTGYLFQLLKITEIACGAALLSGFFVPLALVVITPVVVNIAAYHIFLDPSGQGLGVVAVMVALYGFLTYKHWGVYQTVLQVKPTLAAAPETASAD